MEVHAHAHHTPKNWKQYFWEFLMLFLAVFCGFLAENFREHTVENKRELEFIKSYTKDLQKDIYQLDSLIKKRTERKMQIDSMNFILRSPDPDVYGSQLYLYARYLPRPYLYIPNDATIQQLKSSGNLRLIRKLKVRDTMLAYDQQFRFMESIRIREDQLIQRIFNLLNELFDPAVFDKMNVYDIEFVPPAGNPHLLSKDKKIIQTFLSEINYLKTVNLGSIGWFKKRKATAENILAFIQKQYSLD
jgi:hypothetical protein